MPMAALAVVSALLSDFFPYFPNTDNFPTLGGAPLLPGLYFVSLYLRWRSRSFRFFDFVPLANFVVFLIYPDLGGFQMGPRYWFDGFIVMHITVASTFSRQAKKQ